MIKAGIIGGTGFTAGELTRILIHHPEVEIDFIYSHSKPGDYVGNYHHDLAYTNLTFTDKVNPEVDVVFICLGHGHSKTFLDNNKLSDKTKVIDLSNDFRLNNDHHYAGYDFVYGLPELNKEAIKSAKAIANPGCFATAIQLAILPLAKNGLIQDEIHVNALTGSTGAGQSKTETTHFSWRNNNISIYKAFSHQHLGEITESVQQLQDGMDKSINFLPYRGDFTRGIFASVYMNTEASEEELAKYFNEFYAEAPFTFVTTENVHLKQVVNTNFCFLQVQKLDGKILISSIIDNLVKGASGQAVHNMNLMFNLPETTGLSLKANYF